MTREYGLPDNIIYCKKCVMPNTRPSSSNEYTHDITRKHNLIHFDDDGVCSACRFNEAKWDGTIDWKQRENELVALLDRYRSKDGSYDCLVPGSGGKDSVYASHLLKYKYGMHPLTVTWSPHLYTDVGWRNFENWIHCGGFDNYLFTPNGKIHRLLTRKAFLNILHPFQPFILGQKTYATKMAARFGIDLIFYGEPPGEYGARQSIHENKFSSGSKNSEEHHDGFRLDFVDPGMKPEDIYLGGQSVAQYLDEGYTMGDLEPYLPLNPEIAEKRGLEFHYLGYYLKWIPQEAYYYSVEHTGFEANTERTDGTYSKYNSIDDKTDPFFYYTTLIKFGYGRATQDASQEIRNKHLTREEGVALVKKYDLEFPKTYFKEFLEYISLSEEEFHSTCDKFRSEHIWHKVNGEWKQRHPIE